MEDRQSISCIKCGRNISASGVFCEDCLVDMEKHPVKPGTPVILHEKPEFISRRTATRKTRKPEEQVKLLKRRIGWLWAAIILLLAALLTVTCLWLAPNGKQPSEESRPGENYITNETQETSA